MTQMALPSPEGWDPRVREAVRILENAHPPVPTTVDLAARVGLSVFHFTRIFTAQVGVGPQNYARDYLLQHAAGRLRYTDDPVVEVARDFGYSGLATFVRAFSTRFGQPPGEWRRTVRGALGKAQPVEVRLERLAPITCLGRRYLGPREQGPEQWTDFLSRLPADLRGHARIGLAYDDPRITPPERIRYDCTVQVDRAFTVPGSLAADAFERLVTPAGAWACTDVMNAQDVAAGYGAILGGWLRANTAWTLEGDPFLEFHSGALGQAPSTAMTVCLRVRPVVALATPNMLPAEQE